MQSINAARCSLTITFTMLPRKETKKKAEPWSAVHLLLIKRGVPTPLNLARGLCPS